MDLSNIFDAGGGVTKLARAINRSHSTLLGWRRVPAELVPSVSKATGLPRHQIRPDLYEVPSDEVAA